MPALSESVESQLSRFSAALKHHRMQRGWSLDYLAELSGLSKSFLSRLESGERQVSIAAGLTLCGVFGVSLASLFEPDQAEPCIVVRGDEPAAQSANGLTYWPLSRGSAELRMQPLRVIVPTGREGAEYRSHDGEEWIYVVSGAVTLSLSGRDYELSAGDAAHFEARQPHRLQARGGEAEVLLVAVARSAPPGLRSLSLPGYKFVGKPRVRLGKPTAN